MCLMKKDHFLWIFLTLLTSSLKSSKDFLHLSKLYCKTAIFLSISSLLDRPSSSCFSFASGLLIASISKKPLYNKINSKHQHFELRVTAMEFTYIYICIYKENVSYQLKIFSSLFFQLNQKMKKDVSLTKEWFIDFMCQKKEFKFN